MSLRGSLLTFLKVRGDVAIPRITLARFTSSNYPRDCLHVGRQATSFPRQAGVAPRNDTIEHMQIIVGLGNPGEKYNHTRHNAGFMAVDCLIEQLGLTWKQDKKFNALSCRSGDTIYLKPQTFMNNSGQSVQAILSYYKLLPSRSLLPSWLEPVLSLTKEGAGGGKNSDLSNILTVIHDDIDIELGKYKIATDSRSAGHRGVESIINHLKTKNFKRIRLGIRTELANKIPADKFVLQRFNKEELTQIQKTITELSY